MSYQQGPQANTPVEHVVAGLAATPHVTTHSVLPVQVALQSPSHLTLHVAESAHVIVLSGPTWSLHIALVLQVASEPAPSLKSQFELAVQVTALMSPPIPLHSEESLQVTFSSSVELPLHFEEFVQLSEHALSPHSVLQSTPDVQVHAESVQTQPAPLQTGASSPPQAAPMTKQSETKSRCISPPPR